MYQEMFQRGGLGDFGDPGDCCAGCMAGTGCETGLSSYSPMIQRGGLGQTDDPGSSDFSPNYVPSFMPPDFPTAAPDMAQQILERSIQFVPPAGSGGAAIGQGIIDAVAMGANFVPGVGPIASSVITTTNHLLKALFGWVHIGAGRHEADLITGPPYYIQNKVFDHVVAISQRGLNSTSIPELQTEVIELQQLRAAFLTFLSNVTHFHDGRASAQAADTIMPYLDGTCGYHWPPPLSPDFNTGCGTDHPTPKGNAWPGDFGYGSGLLGVLKARIIDYGGQLPPMTLTQGPTGIPGLDVIRSGSPYLPQAGTLPPVSPLPTWRTPGITPLESGVSGNSLLAIGAAVALLTLL